MTAVTFETSTLSGVGRLAIPFHEDVRGCFSKVFARSVLDDLGIPFQIDEVYWSTSHCGVIRGLHFQNPGSAVAKIVFCTQGRIHDVVLDLRDGSPTYGQIAEFELTPTTGAVVVPAGFAHGFEVLEGPAITCYLQDGPFSSQGDAGVRWDTAGIGWHIEEPIVSDRDRALPDFAAYQSPFRLDGTTHAL
ncbi:MAG: dTDP-4-keto-6-deoxy-D-glucose epimerase [Phycicoccus sp.]|nr:dTDP-4-keto-6-deoxy-D-glucose epimerase [Phycicoccus sp.]